MTMQAKPSSKQYLTIAEWEKLPAYPRYELIDGELTMQVQPAIDHIDVGVELGRQFANYLLGKKCRVLSEAAVRFRENDYTIFAPDLIVVCDTTKIKKNYVSGAPDLVAEILSPSTGKLDKTLKLQRYKQAGVREYWIVDPIHKFVDVYNWNIGPAPQTYGRDDKLHVGVLDDCEIDLSLVFPEPIEEEVPNIEIYPED